MSEQLLSLDYFLNITISKDKLTAFIQFTDIGDPFTCDLSQLEDHLQKHHVVHGIDQDILLQIAANSSERIVEKKAVAYGTQPIDGKDGYIQWMYDLGMKEMRPLLREDGTVNYREITTIHNVRKGQIIAKRIPPEKGSDGKAVTGQTLLAKVGKEARFQIGKNVVTDSEQHAIYAAIDGVVVMTERNKVNVFPIYEVNGDVDFRVGNINFVGSVVIRGSVHPGFRIRAMGDIRITGGVEAAELEADGSIEIHAGVLGQNKGFIRAGKDVKSSFIQEGIIEAGEDVFVSQSILHSTVRAGRSVICQGAKGLIVGGVIQAGERVVARTIGNSMATITVIEAGVIPELRNNLIQLRHQVRSQMESLDKTVKALAMLDQYAAAGQLSPERLKMRLQLSHTKNRTMDTINTLKEAILEMEKSLESTENARVVVGSMVYGGTKIAIGRYTKFIKDTTSRTCFRIENGDIVFSANF